MRNTAAYCERNCNLTCRPLYNLDHGSAPFNRSGDVQEHKLIRPLLVVSSRQFNRVTRISQVYEIDAFNNAAILHVKTRYDTFRQHIALSFFYPPGVKRRANIVDEACSQEPCLGIHHI
ncbi:hypothetical protein D3C78_1626170 [compost metagenome]